MIQTAGHLVEHTRRLSLMIGETMKGGANETMKIENERPAMKAGGQWRSNGEIESDSEDARRVRR